MSKNTRPAVRRPRPPVRQISAPEFKEYTNAVNTSVSFEPTLLRKLNNFCHRGGHKRSAIIRKALLMYFKSLGE